MDLCCGLICCTVYEIFVAFVVIACIACCLGCGFPCFCLMVAVSVGLLFGLVVILGL